MIIQKLQIKGYKTYGTKVSLSFPEKGIIGILGSNESGKTTLFDAILIGLFGPLRKEDKYSKGEIISWNSDSASITINFTAQQQNFRIKRKFRDTGKNIRHDVKLENLDTNEILENITEVEKRINQILGLDAETFVNLIYIKQKELDVLKQLSKKKRESMINKLLSLDIFDKSKPKVKEDCDKFKVSEKILEPEVRKLEEEVDKLKQLNTDKENLDKTIKKQKEELDNLNSKLISEQMQKIRLEWLRDKEEVDKQLEKNQSEIKIVKQKIATREELKREKTVLEQKISAIGNVEEKLEYSKQLSDVYKKKETIIKEIKSLECKLKKHQQNKDLSEKTLDEVNDPLICIMANKQVMKKLEEDINITKENLKNSNSKIALLLEKHDSSEKEIIEIENKAQSRTLIYGIVAIIGLVLILLSIFLFTQNTVIGLGLFLTSVITSCIAGYNAKINWTKYLDHKEIIQERRNVQQMEKKLSIWIREKEELVDSTGFISYNSMVNTENQLLELIKKRFDLSTLEELKMYLKNELTAITTTQNHLDTEKENLVIQTELENTLKDKLPPFSNIQLLIQNFEEKLIVKNNLKDQLKTCESKILTLNLEKLDITLKNLQTELESLNEKNTLLISKKPDNAEQLIYSNENLEEVLESIKNLTEIIQKLSNEFNANKGSLKVIEQQIDGLKESPKQLELKTTELKEIRYNISVYSQLMDEMKETAKVQRQLILPAIRVRLGRIAPILTDNRYESFEISEELSFNVYSSDAKLMKSRELFSGGTQDQFLFALRLVFTETLLEAKSKSEGESYAIFMDECISSSDKYRKKQIFEVLRIKNQIFPQIFIISHEDIGSEVDYEMIVDRDNQNNSFIKSKSW